jgi:PadR family transcriptional regulator
MTRRRTKARVRVARAMLNRPSGRHYGYNLMTAAHVLSGTLYPILDQMLADGWVTDDWDVDERTNKPRRYYTLTDHGRRQLDDIVAEAETID